VRGGYNVPVAGAPLPEVRELPASVRLYLPLASRRFGFSDVRVGEGQRVVRGEVLAVDLERFSIPLLAPYGGIVRLGEVEGHIVLDELDTSPGAGVSSGSVSGGPVAGPGGGPAAGSTGKPIAERLLTLGAWQYLSDARTGDPVDPLISPSATIASTLRLEPFLAGGEAQLDGALERLARGLEHLRGMAPEAPLYVVVPNAEEPLAAEIRKVAAACSGAHTVSVPMRFPFDDPALLARYLKLPAGPDATIWAIPVEGVLAVEAALTDGRPCTERIVSFAGPAVREPVHFRLVPGYPVADILADRLCREPARVVNGGLLTGPALPPEQRGIDSECTGLTVVGEPTRQTLLSFARPGISRRSYNRSFVGTLRTDMSMRYKAGLSGEVRPCIACGQCADVCPAEILPQMIHRHLYADRLEEAQRIRVDLCVGCGLCSFVCPSKIDLRTELLDAKRVLREEEEALRAEAEAEAAQAAETEAAQAGEVAS
jgi:Na+-transporting NADH:ubiquinone oxidoreductase subunit A